jgi:hypothetical protein
MKKLILIIVLSAACSSTLSAVPVAQNDGKNMDVRQVEVVRSDNATVTVSFTIELGADLAASTRSLIILPVIEGANGERSELSPVIVRGSRASAAAEILAMSGAGISAEGRYVVENGATLDYRALTRWREWMPGSKLVFTGLNTGRDRATDVAIGVVASDLLDDGTVAGAAGAAGAVAGTYTPTYTPAYVPEPVRVPMIGTIGDELAARFSFVDHVSKYHQARGVSSIDAVFDYNMPLVFGSSTVRQQDEVARFIEMTRSGALCVAFEKGSVVMERNVGQNNSMLVDLISAIRVLESSHQTRVARVIVVGFSAPEGDSGEKETLALERAAATRDLLTSNSRIDPAVIDIYNGAADWMTLRSLVSESDMPGKYKVLDIIDNVPAWGGARDKGRLAQLMALDGGTVYRHMRDNFFPRLRQTGAYVKVYYENVR